MRHEGINVADADDREACVCPYCDKRVVFKTCLTGKNVECPNCGKSMTLCTATASVWYESPTRDRFSSVAGWVTSIVLHCLLLLSFTGITWTSGVGTGADERNVGIVIESDVSISSSGNGGLSPLEPRSLALTGPSLPTPERNLLSENLGSSAASSGTDVDIAGGVLEGGAAGAG